MLKELGTIIITSEGVFAADDWGFQGGTPVTNFTRVLEWAREQINAALDTIEKEQALPTQGEPGEIIDFNGHKRGENGKAAQEEALVEPDGRDGGEAEGGGIGPEGAVQ